MYEQDGEELQVPSSGNFPMVLHAYMMNRFDKKARWYNVAAYQKWLKDYKVGRFVTSALDAVYEKDRKSLIDPALQTSVFGGLETHVTHAIVIEELKPYLPSELSSSILYDPPFENQDAS